MSNTPSLPFPFNQVQFPCTLWETGNAPDYSTIYNQGVKAGRGETTGGKMRWNNPKNDPITSMEYTGEGGEDIAVYNYCEIDYGGIGGGKKFYFIVGKTFLNYPDINQGNWYAMRFDLVFDVWETYKDQIGSPKIALEQVTTNNPSGWEDTSMLEQDILPFSSTKIMQSDEFYSSWKTVVGWQSNKPNAQDNFILDGMRTTLQFEETTSGYLVGLDDLATGTPEETNVWKTYIACNTYVVSDFFNIENGGNSNPETITLANPPSTQIHNRLNYYPYKRAFIKTVDGQNLEFDYKQYADKKLPASLSVKVDHSMLPQPSSLLIPVYDNFVVSESLLFSGYPTMDFVGKNITPITQLMSWLDKTDGGLNYERW